MYKTKDVSKLAGVSKRTLQYYDELGLIQVERDKNGHRIYKEQVLEELSMIQMLKQVGFTLDEIKGMRGLSNQQLQFELDNKITSIDKEIDSLNLNKKLIEWIKANGLNPPKEDTKLSILERIERLESKLKSCNK